MLKTPLLALLAVALAAPTALQAGVASTGKEAKPIVEETKESWITGDIGFNVVNQYVSRGLIFENQGFIIQPYADLYFKLYEGDGFLNSITLNLGIWESFHSRRTDAGLVSGGSTCKSWYEADFTPGLSFTFAKNFTLTTSWYTFLSPNDGFDTFQGVNFKLAINDSDWLGAFALHPTLQFLIETDNKAGSGPSQGYYYEVGIAPALPAFGPVTVSFPVTAGFGSDGFYVNDGLGFVQGGISVAYAMNFIPEKWGTWTLTSSASYLYLNDDLKDFNTGPGRIRDSNDSEFIYQGGLMIAF